MKKRRAPPGSPPATRAKASRISSAARDQLKVHQTPCVHDPSRHTGESRYPSQPWVPAFEAVIQLAFIAPSLPNYAIPAQAGTHSAAGVELSDGTRSQK